MFKKLKGLKGKLWFNIFWRVSLIFAAFVAILALANSVALESFFEYRQKGILIKQLELIDKVDLEDYEEVSELLSDINEDYQIDTEIYTEDGQILYTTHSRPMMDFIISEQPDFPMFRDEMIPESRENLKDGVVSEWARSRVDDTEFLLCRSEIEDGIFAEVRISRLMVSSSAQTAGQFLSVIAVICFMISIIWVLLFARKFSKPLSKMSQITADMSNLNFERKLEVKGNDEIAQLAHSINELSSSLSVALNDLKQSNARLRDEIELERSLDTMRKAFVANVSHELKTPLAIISGYAEGLKLNINSMSKDEYCDTIMDECARMNRLVLSILELSRYESGQRDAKKENFDICTLTCDMIKRFFEGTTVKTTCSIPQEMKVFADPLQIEQALKSYLENALAHTPEDGIVTVKSEEKNDKIRICVFNSGSFVKEEDMPQIWQSFYRGDRSHKRDESRFGLGLSIVNAIMKTHGTDCGVYNLSDGVCFWFEVEKAQEEIEK